MSGQPVTKVWRQSHLSHGRIFNRVRCSLKSDDQQRLIKAAAPNSNRLHVAANSKWFGAFFGRSNWRERVWVLVLQLFLTSARDEGTPSVEPTFYTLLITVPFEWYMRVHRWCLFLVKKCELSNGMNMHYGLFQIMRHTFERAEYTDSNFFRRP